MKRLSASLCIIAVSLAASPSPAGAAVDDRVAADGSVRLDGVTIPLSPLMSEEARAYMRHVIVDQPFGTPESDIVEERRRQDAIMARFMLPIRRDYRTDVSEEVIGGVVTDVVVPSGGIEPRNRQRVLINVHGGGFMTGGRTASLVESIPISALMGIRVISVDYRMAPEFQFPAASEDVARVYRELLKTYAPGNIGLYGCSAGGFLAAQSTAWFLSHELPPPGALGVFCASLGGYFGGDATALAGPLNGHLPATGDRAAPSEAPRQVRGYMDPALADDGLAYPRVSRDLMSRFPPTLFVSGTRSFEMSMALDSHNALAATGVESQFHAWDGLNHAFFYNSELPESREAYSIMVDFFEKHLGN